MMTNRDIQVTFNITVKLFHTIIYHLSVFRVSTVSIGQFQPKVHERRPRESYRSQCKRNLLVDLDFDVLPNHVTVEINENFYKREQEWSSIKESIHLLIKNWKEVLYQQEFYIFEILSYYSFRLCTLKQIKDFLFITNMVSQYGLSTNKKRILYSICYFNKCFI